LWFNARKGLAIGMVTAGGAFGQGIVPYLGRLLITEFGWRDAMLALGVGYFAILFPLMFLLKPAPAAEQPTDRAARADGNLWNVPHAITLPWLGFAALFCCVCMAASQVHLVPLDIDLGCSPQTAAGLLLTMMVTGVFGRLFFGWLADRTGGLRAYFLASLAQTSVVFWFTQTRSVATLLQLSVLFGFGFSGVMTCLLICAREAAPLRLSGLAMAVVSTVGWIGMGLGSYQAGLFYDLSASYVLSFANAAIAGILNLLVVAALFWYRQQRTPRPAKEAQALGS
jgi:predicted MFS family arabinose efflux permease